MSELRSILAEVIADRAPSFADVVTHSSGSLSAEIEEVQDIEANVLLGRDPRESVIFHIQDRGGTSAIAINDTLMALGQTFRVLRRTDNPVSNQVDFGAMKITDKDA